jgi:hypothetical protein
MGQLEIILPLNAQPWQTLNLKNILEQKFIHAYLSLCVTYMCTLSFKEQKGTHYIITQLHFGNISVILTFHWFT